MLSQIPTAKAASTNCVGLALTTLRKLTRLVKSSKPFSDSVDQKDTMSQPPPNKPPPSCDLMDVPTTTIDNDSVELEDSSSESSELGHDLLQSSRINSSDRYLKRCCTRNRHLKY